MANYWMENAIQPGRHVLADCGPWGDAETKERFLRMRERVALRNCERVGNDRLVVRLPPTVAPAVLAAMPEIQPGAAGYCWCTHGFAKPNAGSNGPRQAQLAEGPR